MFMWYVIGIPVLLVVITAILSDLRKKKSINNDLTSAKELGNVQFYKDINNNGNN